MNKSAEHDHIISEASEHPLIIYGIIITFVTIGGILFNLAVIFVTIRTKSFRGSMHILLAFYSMSEIVNLSGNFLSIFAAFSGHYFMPLKRVIYFVIVSLVGFGCAMNLMFFIGIERMFVVLFPLKNFNKKIFLATVFQFNLIYAIGYAIMSLKCAEDEFISIEIFGNYYEIGQTIGRCSIIAPFSTTIMIITVTLYASIAIVLHCRKVPSNSNSAQFNNRIFRSLFTILSANFGGYLILFLSFFVIVPMLHDIGTASWHTTQIVGILMHFSASSNGPILYLTSSEYREAFRKTFAVLIKAFGKSSSVGPQPLFTQNVQMKNTIQTKV